MLNHYPRPVLFGTATALLVAVGIAFQHKDWATGLFIMASAVIFSFILQSQAYLADQATALRMDVDAIIERDEVEGKPRITRGPVKPVVINPFGSQVRPRPDL